MCSLQMLELLRVVPWSSEQVEEYLERYSALDEHLKALTADLLHSALVCLNRLHRATRRRTATGASAAGGQSFSLSMCKYCQRCWTLALQHSLPVSHLLFLFVCPVDQSDLNDTATVSCLGRLRNQAKTLVTYAGLIPYTLPQDLYTRLVHLESDMVL